MECFTIAQNGTTVFKFGTKDASHIHLFKRVDCYDGWREYYTDVSTVMWIKNNTIHVLQSMPRTINSIDTMEEFKRYYRCIHIPDVISHQANVICYVEKNKIYQFPIDQRLYYYLSEKLPPSRIDVMSTQMYCTDCVNWKNSPTIIFAICLDKKIIFFLPALNTREDVELKPAFEIPLRDVVEYRAIGDIEKIYEHDMDVRVVQNQGGFNTMGAAAGAMIGGAVMGTGGAFLGAMAGFRTGTSTQEYHDYVDNYEEIDNRITVLRAQRNGELIDFIFAPEFYDYLKKVTNEPCPVIKFKDGTISSMVISQTRNINHFSNPNHFDNTNIATSNLRTDAITPSNLRTDVITPQNSNTVMKYTKKYAWGMADIFAVNRSMTKIAKFLNLDFEHVVGWAMGQEHSKIKSNGDICTETLLLAIKKAGMIYNSDDSLLSDYLVSFDVVSKEEVHKIVAIKESGKYYRM